MSEQQHAPVEQLEVEVMFLAKPKNWDFLEHASSSVEQEQYDLVSFSERDAKGEYLGMLRMRREVKDGVQTYLLVSKLNQARGVQDETTIEVSKEVFDMFRAVRDGIGWLKTRHYFPVDDVSMLPEALQSEELVWEVDVYTNGTENDAWVKVDLELPATNEEQVQALKQIDQLPKLPMDCSVVLAGADDREQSKKAREEHFERWATLLHDKNVTIDQTDGEQDVSLESLSRLASSLIRRKG